jgi:hypothetical protein
MLTASNLKKRDSVTDGGLDSKEVGRDYSGIVVGNEASGVAANGFNFKGLELSAQGLVQTFLDDLQKRADESFFVGASSNEPTFF